MSQYNQLPYKKPTSLNRLVVVILIIGILMAVFLSFFFNYQKPIEKAGFKNIVAHFTDKVLIVKSQWLMSGKPEKFIMKTTEQKEPSTFFITVNQFGWVDSNNIKNACENIWLTVMERPLEFFNAPINVRLINNQLISNSSLNNTHNNAKNKSQFWGHHCRYTVKSGEYFEYNSQVGVVSKVIN